MMTIGICIRHVGEHLEEGFRNAGEMGFHYCQLLSWDRNLWTEEEADRIRTLCRQYEITITEFWCGWDGPKVWNFTEGPATLGIVPPEYREERCRNLLEGAAFARKLGIKDVATHMGFLPENLTDPLWPGVCAAVKRLGESLKASGQNLLFETGQETPVVLLRLFETVGTGNLFVNLDPANLILYGKGNPVDALDLLGDYVRGVHAKDGLYPSGGLELGQEVRLGDGKVNFPALLRGLRAHGYQGSLTIEREITGEEQIRDIQYARELLEKILWEMEQETEEAQC